MITSCSRSIRAEDAQFGALEVSMRRRSDLRPRYQKWPRLVLLGMVAVTLPVYLLAGAIAGAWDRANDWWAELVDTWDMQD